MRFDGKDYDDEVLLKLLGDAFSHAFDEGSDAFHIKLNGPHQMTILRSDGQFRKMALIGGNTFVLKGAYMGKKAGIILKMIAVEKTEIPIVHFEIPLTEALMKFDYLRDHVGDILSRDPASEDAAMADARTEAKRLEEDAHWASMVSANMEDERYGSW